MPDFEVTPNSNWSGLVCGGDVEPVCSQLGCKDRRLSGNATDSFTQALNVTKFACAVHGYGCSIPEAYGIIVR